MPLQAIAQLLQTRMGLHSATVGSSTIASAVEQRMRVCGIETIADYRDVVAHSDTELDALIDAVVIPETWFFRDSNAFSAFSQWVCDDWAKHSAGAQLRVLSVPCSSGEEPYSLAMCLADRGIDASAAQIDAVDISNVNLDKARKAEYGHNSFRGSNLLYRDRHFGFHEPYYRLNAEVRRRVRFERGNLLDSSFAEQRPPYDVIFCRNLLIYFDRPTQERAIDQLEQLLTKKGVLFLGHSETSLLQHRGFAPLALERCFGFRRVSAVAQAPASTAVRRRCRPTLKPRAPKTTKPATNPLVATGEKRIEPPRDKPHPDSRAVLRRAFQLADQGHMDEAAARCESLLRDKACRADAHFLLAVIREAAGSTQEAEQMFRKTIYLQPDHYEALVHLSLLCEKDGDGAEAKRLRERADRARLRLQTREVGK